MIGHKNPDTDSICSAIVYARLKGELLGQEAAAFRAGNLNLQTAFVLDRFTVDSPPLLTDVYPRIADIMIKERELITLRPQSTLGEAQSILCEKRFSFLPVADERGRYAGEISALRLAGLTAQLASLCRRERLTVDLGRFLRDSGSRLLTRGSRSGVFSGRLLIPGFGRGLQGGACAGAAVIAPWSEELMAAAIEGGAGVVVACGEADAGQALLERAQARGTRLIAAPCEPLDAVVHFLLAMPIADFVEGDQPAFRIYDRVRRVQREVGKYNKGGFAVLDDQGRIRGVLTRVNLLEQSRSRLVLVDHNEASQAVEGIEEAEVVEVIDHHRLGARSTDAPITFINKAVGSTATIIAELYRNLGFVPDPTAAGLLLAAVLSDTLVLKSPTTAALDLEMANWLAGEAALEIAGFGEAMFAAGSALEGVDPERLIGQDRKSYEEGGWRFSVSQLETVGFKNIYERKGPLLAALTEAFKREGLHFSCLMITDLTESASLLLCAGDRKVIEAITYPKVEENTFELKGVLSRKKQVIPYLIDLLRRL